VDWINLAHDLDKWRAFVYSVMEISYPQNEGVSLTSWGTESFTKSVRCRVGHSQSESQTAGCSTELLGFWRKQQRPCFRAHWGIVQRDWHTHTVMLSHATSGLSQHSPCQTLLRPTGWKILKGNWNLCGSELSREDHSSHKPRADNILFKCLTRWRCQLLSSYSVDNKRMNEYRALME